MFHINPHSDIPVYRQLVKGAAAADGPKVHRAVLLHGRDHLRAPLALADHPRLAQGDEQGAVGVHAVGGGGAGGADGLAGPGRGGAPPTSRACRWR